MTRDEILNLPADQLPEVTARVMGWEIYKHVGQEVTWRVRASEDAYWRDWQPHTDHNDAREVAEWACAQWDKLIHPTSEAFKIADPRESIDFTLDELMGTCMTWHWTPDQLTRATLLALHDAGKEIL